MSEISVFYNEKTDTISHCTDLHEESAAELIEIFLQSQMGAGKDCSPVHEKNVYTVKLSIDLSDDTITVNSNTGNKSLRDGILIEALQQMRKAK